MGRSSRRPTTLWWTWAPPRCTACSTTTTSATRASENSPGGARTSWGPGTVITLLYSLLRFEYLAILPSVLFGQEQKNDNNRSNKHCQARCQSETLWTLLIELILRSTGTSDCEIGCHLLCNVHIRPKPSRCKQTTMGFHSLSHLLVRHRLG